MTNRELEQRIRTAVEHAAPDQLDSILSSCDQEKTEGAVIHMTKINKTKSRKVGLTAIAAVAAVFLLCVGGFHLMKKDQVDDPVNFVEAQVDSIILLDVNPSLSLSVDADEAVLEAKALNDDAKEVLGNMELKGTSLEVAVNAIIGSMLQKGYLGDLQNSILVSVENQDAVRSEELQKKVSDAITDAMESGSLELAVLSQAVSAEDAVLKELAEQYGISLGKAALIQEVIAQVPSLTFEELAPRTINEIALITASKHVVSDSVTQTGTASDKAYIGAEEALNRAYAHAGVTAADILRVETEFDCEDGVMVYEVEFETESRKYEYDINAITGEILKVEMKDKNHSSESEVKETENEKPESSTEKPEISTETPVDNSRYIGENAAMEAALNDVGVQETDTVYIHCYKDYYHGREQNYHVEFMVGNTKYNYKIDFYSGAVLEKYEDTYDTHGHDHDHEHSSSHSSSSGSSQDSNASYIGESAALSIALNHAGIAESDLTEKAIELDEHSNRMVYEIELRVGRDQYKYEIDAVSGTIVKAEIDLHD